MEGLKLRRIDAWESRLTDEQQRELYRWTQTPREVKVEGEGEGKVVRRPNFDECMARLDEMGVPRPSRGAWFRFKAAMQKMLREELLYSVAASSESAKDLKEMTPADYALAADTFTNLAIDASMKGNDKAVSIYSGAARHYREMMQQEKKLDLQSRAQATKEDQLRLAREKFEAAERRLAAVQDAVASAKTKGGLTEDTLKKIEEAAGLL